MNTAFFVGSGFALFGIYMCRLALRKYKKSLASESWPAVKGKIGNLSLWGNRNIDGKMQAAEKLSLEYEYSVKDSAYSNTEVAFHTLMYPETTNYADSYPIDSNVTVYFNPAKPEESILIPGPRKDGKRYSGLIIAIIGTLAGIVISISAWFGLVG